MNTVIPAPPTRASHSTMERLRLLRSGLEASIRGQSHLMERVVSVLVRGEMGFAHPDRPKGSFLFVGPTGVGKTELTQVFTAHLFEGRKPVRFDMSEYQNQASVEKLIGQSTDEIGLLGRALLGVEEGTLLFDEIEKAHPLVLDLFLQILDDASITLASGERKNLSRFYVVFTSNIGSGEVMRMTSAPMATVERTVLNRVGQQLRPELVGRITEKIVFARLPFETQREICEMMIAREQRRLHRLGFPVEPAPAAVEFLIRRGYHKTLGARPMRATVERFLQDAVTESLLRGHTGCGLLIVAEDGERLVLAPNSDVSANSPATVSIGAQRAFLKSDKSLIVTGGGDLAGHFARNFPSFWDDYAERAPVARGEERPVAHLDGAIA